MNCSNNRGFVLITTLLMMSVLLMLLGAYTVITDVETSTGKMYGDSTKGFFAAEAGLNIRAEDIRQIFLGYNRPSGESPDPANRCEGSNQGSGDFICREYEFGSHNVTTWVEEETPEDEADYTPIPPGERYAGLNALEYLYRSFSVAKGFDDKVESILELRFISRLVPMFQFVAFYDKDLEILPGPAMVLNGPVHTNGDLYLMARDKLHIFGQVTAAGSIYRGRKDTTECTNYLVKISDPSVLRSLMATCPTRTLITESNTNLSQWNGNLLYGVDVLTVPPPEDLDPIAGNIYWDKADMRLVLRLNSLGNPDTSFSTNGVEVRNAAGSVIATATSALNSCSGSIGESPAGAGNGKAVGTTISFKNNREGKMIRMLDVDMRAFLNCAASQGLFDLANTSEGGTVLHLTVDGPNSGAAANNYGVRVRKASELQSNLAGASLVKGLTIVSDQAFYAWGNFNSTNKIPAAILADTFNALSNGFLDSESLNADADSRVADTTIVNAGLLAGTDSTGGIEGPGGQGGDYNGGLENYPRFHEKWTNIEWRYRGSFVSLGTPRHQSGNWVYGDPQYYAPTRNWDFDQDFKNAAKLPPLSPRFVYLRQLLFVRQFEQQEEG